APVHTRLAGRRLVGDEQLEGARERRLGCAAGRLEPLELVAELRAEELVDRGEHLWPRAMVEGQRKDGLGGVAPLAEHGDVRVAEPVDRLELVPDHEQVAARSLREEIQQL